MTHSPARVVREALKSLGVVVDGTSFVDFMPDNQAISTCFYNTPGRLQGIERAKPDGAPTQVRKPGIQVRVRSLASQAANAYDKIETLRIACLQQVRDFSLTIGSDPYRIESLTMTSDILTLGRDPSNQFASYTFNLVATIDQF